MHRLVTATVVRVDWSTKFYVFSKHVVKAASSGNALTEAHGQYRVRTASNTLVKRVSMKWYVHSLSKSVTIPRYAWECQHA